MKTSPRADRVSVYAFAHSTPIWWDGIATKLTRARNLTVWQVPTEQSQALAALAQLHLKQNDAGARRLDGVAHTRRPLRGID